MSQPTMSQQIKNLRKSMAKMIRMERDNKRLYLDIARENCLLSLSLSDIDASRNQHEEEREQC